MLNANEPPRPSPESSSPPPSIGESGRAPTGIASLIGAACLIAVAADLGVPLQQPVAMAVLLTISGYCLARAVCRNTSSGGWRFPMIIGLAGRAVPAVLLVVTLSGLYEMVSNGGLAKSQSLAMLAAVTFTSNIVPFTADADYLPLEHFWAVALVAQTAIAAPWLLTVAAHKIDRRRRAQILLALAGLLSLTRMIATSINGDAIWLAPPPSTISGLIAVWTMLDSLLVGLAVGIMPLASLHRHPTTKMVIPALGAIAALLVAPSFVSPLITIGLRLPLAAVLTGAVLAAAAIFSLPLTLDRVVSSPWLYRIGARSFGLYLWHIPFAHAVGDGNPYRWHGSAVFIVVLTLALAAATTMYRSIELPAQSTLRWLVRRWFPSDVIDLTTPPPQREKWRRWDEISLDNLPRPGRRRSESVSAGRLWQQGDRTTVEGQPVEQHTDEHHTENPEGPAIAS